VTLPQLPRDLELVLGGTRLDTHGSGNINVIASHGAIVVVGDGADLNANSGPVSQGGIVALDTVDSQLSTGNGTSRDSSVDPDPSPPSGSSPPASDGDEEQSVD
jgi:hypothetical protein